MKLIRDTLKEEGNQLSLSLTKVKSKMIEHKNIISKYDSQRKLEPYQNSHHLLSPRLKKIFSANKHEFKAIF
jgi:hypothetical protein